MSLAIFRAMLLGLLRDRGALLMSFFLPAVFFVIMAEIFTATTGDSLNLKVAVLDEADRMFDLGFIRDIRYLLRRMPEPADRLNLLFSATSSTMRMVLPSPSSFPARISPV